jgi:hypothetical protein
MLTALAALTPTAQLGIVLLVVGVVVVAVILVRRRRGTPDMWLEMATDETRRGVLAHLWLQQVQSGLYQPFQNHTSPLAEELQVPRELLERAVSRLLEDAYLQTDQFYDDGSRLVHLTKAGYDAVLYGQLYRTCMQNQQA